MHDLIAIFSLSLFFSSQFFPEVVAILAFLSELIVDIKTFAGSVKMPLKSCDRLLNDEFTQLFSAQALSNYTSYDPDHVSSLDDDGETHMISQFITIKLKVDHNITVDELAEKTTKLQASNEQLQENLIETDVQKCFAGVSQQVMAQERELQNLQEILNEKQTHLKIVMLKHDERAAKLHAAQTICDDLVARIQNQTFTTLDIKQLMAKETTIKSSMAMIQDETEAIKVHAADDQVKLARLQKLKMDTIKRFNEVTFQIAEKLMESSAFQKLNVNDLTIDPAASITDIQKVCIHLKVLKESCEAFKQQFCRKIEQAKAKMTACMAEFERLTAKYTDDMTKFHMNSKQLDEMNQRCANHKSDGSADEMRIQREIHDQIAYKKQLAEHIDELKVKVANLQAENIELVNVGDQKSREIIRVKQSAIKQMDKLGDFIDGLMGDDNDDDVW